MKKGKYPYREFNSIQDIKRLGEIAKSAPYYLDGLEFMNYIKQNWRLLQKALIKPKKKYSELTINEKINCRQQLLAVILASNDLFIEKDMLKEMKFPFENYSAPKTGNEFIYAMDVVLKRRELRLFRSYKLNVRFPELIRSIR